jgi:hypothetical protein
MILDGLDECAGQIAENESKEERQSTLSNLQSHLKTLSTLELQRFYQDELNRARQQQN